MSDTPLRLVTPPAEDRPADDNQPTPAPAVEPLLLSARDVAALLGVSLRTVRAMDSSGRIPEPIRITRGCVRWKLSEVRSWINAGAPDRATWARLRARK
jgi:predicted DNA-binding transcriptional regulator AlpA